MKKPKMNYSEKNGMKVLADPTYGKIRTCKRCGTRANLEDGYCEACFHEVKN